MFLPGLRMLIPERAQWGIPIFTDGSKLGEDTGAAAFRRELGIELHVRLYEDCSMFQAEIFAILKAIVLT